MSAFTKDAEDLVLETLKPVADSKRIGNRVILCLRHCNIGGNSSTNPPLAQHECQCGSWHIAGTEKPPRKAAIYSF